MVALTVKNIPEELFERLKRSAELNHRSINSEVIVCIERAVSTRKADPESALVRARRLREQTVDYTISDEEFNAAKAAGRS